MVLGTLRVGKSSLLNVLAGRDQAFVAKRSPQAVTKEPKVLEFDQFNLVDTPGLHDTKMN